MLLLWILLAIAGLTSLCGWLSAALHSLLLLSHVAPPRTAASLLFQGFRFYQRDTFLPSGWPLHRRFEISVGAFILGVLAIAVLAVLIGWLGQPTGQ